MEKKANIKWMVIIALLLGLLVLLIWWLKPSNSVKPADVAQAQHKVNQATKTTNGDLNLPEPATNYNAASANINFTTGLEQMPRSLRDTDVDGEIIIDSNKQLVVTEGLRRLFDYFLSALGEEDEAVIIKRVEAYIRHHTPEPAASQAVAIFQQYVSYLKALTHIKDNYGNLQMQATQNGKLDLNLVKQRKQDVAKLRQQFFDDKTIQAFFGNDDAYDDYSMAMIQIEQNDLLNPKQKQAARNDYISRLPEGPIKQNIDQQRNLATLMQRTQELKQQGASAQELFAMRQELVGEAAAQRLAKVDAEEADFDARFTAYQQQRQQLIDNADSEQAAQAQIEALEKQYFDELERKRLTGYAQLKQAEAKQKNNK